MNSLYILISGQTRTWALLIPSLTPPTIDISTTELVHQLMRKLQLVITCDRFINLNICVIKMKCISAKQF